MINPISNTAHVTCAYGTCTRRVPGDPTRTSGPDIRVSVCRMLRRRRPWRGGGGAVDTSGYANDRDTISIPYKYISNESYRDNISNIGYGWFLGYYGYPYRTIYGPHRGPGREGTRPRSSFIRTDDDTRTDATILYGQRPMCRAGAGHEPDTWTGGHATDSHDTTHTFTLSHGTVVAATCELAPSSQEPRVESRHERSLASGLEAGEPARRSTHRPRCAYS
jgi:hypothetical protein